MGFRSLRESIDTTTSGGRLVFHLFGALAQFEREIIRDRTQAGLASARARGRFGGRPPKLSADQVRTARRLFEERALTVAEIGACWGSAARRSTGRCTASSPRPQELAGKPPAAGEHRARRRRRVRGGGSLAGASSVVQHRRGRQPWRVKSVTKDGALLSDLAGEVARLPLAVLVPDRVEAEHPTGGGGL